MNEMNVLIMTVGIQGSGKSTWAKEMVKIGVAARTNKDEIRLANPKFKERQVIEFEDNLLKRYMQNGHPIVICDNTHLNKRHWDRLKNLALAYGYRFEIKWFDDSLDGDLCQRRNIQSGRTPVPFQAIETAYQQYFQHWMQRENIPEPKRQGVPTVLVDIDGTVAENPGTRGFFEWDKVGQDLPHEDVIALVSMFQSTGHRIVFMSGRDEVSRDLTEAWITEHMGIMDPIVYMRQRGDMRNDAIVKLELYRTHIEPSYLSVKYVLDDRHRVVRMWRALGLRTLAVANGFF